MIQSRGDVWTTDVPANEVSRGGKVAECFWRENEKKKSDRLSREDSLRGREILVTSQTVKEQRIEPVIFIETFLSFFAENFCQKLSKVIFRSRAALILKTGETEHFRKDVYQFLQVILTSSQTCS